MRYLLTMMTVLFAGVAAHAQTTPAPQMTHNPVASARNWTENFAIPVSVTVRSGPIKNLAVKNGDFQDESGSSFPYQFQLCENASGPCTAPSETGDEATLYIRPNMNTCPGGASHTNSDNKTCPTTPPPGIYKGTLGLKADGTIDLPPFPIEIRVTSSRSRWAGVGLLVLGVLLSIFVTGSLGFRTQMLTRLRPLVDLRARGTMFKDELVALKAANAGLVTSRLDATFEALLGDLTPERLRAFGLSTSWLRSFFPVVVDEASIKALAEMSARKLVLLRALIVRGLAAVAPALAGEDTKAAALKAITALDALADLPGDTQPGDFDQKIDQIVATYNSETGEKVADLQSSMPTTVKDIDYDLARISLMGWAVFVVLTVLIGTYAMILSKPGFGTLQDLLLCLLWGFGLPTGGTALTALSPDSIREKFKLPTTA